MSTIYPYSLDDLFAASSVGSLDRALANNLYGLNCTKIQSFSPTNRDDQGFIFMTRPQLNLQKLNLRNVRELYPLLNDDPRSQAKAIRMILDPRIGAGYRYHNGYKMIEIPPTTSLLVDNEQAFIPMVTNNTITASGWPDMRLNTWTSDPGLHKQVQVLPDGVAHNYGEWDLTINLQNTAGDPTSAAMFVWLHYMAAVKKGTMDPYFDYLLNDRIDFNTRVYRVILNQNRDRVEKIMACVAGFPISNPIGMFGDFNRATPFSEQTKEISINIKCVGCIVYDPLLIDHFNKTVQAFCTSMKDDKREQSMVKLTKAELTIFKFRVYPRIDPDTMEMQWWTKRDTYSQLAGNIGFTEFAALNGTQSNT